MHDDVPYGEGTSYTQGTGIAINNNVIAVDADNTPTENSEKPVKSKGVYEVVEQIYADNGVLGAKNLLPNNATNQTVNGVTFTVNADGSVTANGTATADSYFAWDTGLTLNIEINEVSVPTKNGYTISGCDDAENAKYYVGLTSANRGYIVVKNGITVSNKVFYPMLRLASDPDDTYVPYAMTNRELTEELTVQESAVTDIISGASITNNHNNLYKQGKFVHMCIEMQHVTATAYDTIIAKVPSNYKPRAFVADCTMSNTQIARIYVDGNNGNVKCRNALSDASFVATATWITD